MALASTTINMMSDSTRVAVWSHSLSSRFAIDGSQRGDWSTGRIQDDAWQDVLWGPPTGTTLHIKRPCEPHCRIIAIGAGGSVCILSVLTSFCWLLILLLLLLLLRHAQSRYLSNFLSLSPYIWSSFLLCPFFIVSYLPLLLLSFTYPCFFLLSTFSPSSLSILFLFRNLLYDFFSSCEL